MDKIIDMQNLPYSKILIKKAGLIRFSGDFPDSDLDNESMVANICNLIASIAHSADHFLFGNDEMTNNLFILLKENNIETFQNDINEFKQYRENLNRRMRTGETVISLSSMNIFYSPSYMEKLKQPLNK